jgi:hypothetical protein
MSSMALHHATPASVAGLLCGFRIRFAGELDVQLAVAEILDRNRISYQREFRLSPRERLDFLLRFPGKDSSIAIEIKIKGRTAELLRQLERYAGHEFIAGLVLVTSRRLQAAQMPDSLNGKPLAVAMIGGL